ncbi:PspA/IM30 family protein [Mesorhizobium sp. M9A.F.Ca.ET.002.03.1.2]|uniref:PspA/IM30 family protein n=1 Tax=Mesorhizobium sp. M9A.F.Ca.ET.002.03.1.2 TaxID=2493668 RepID=UPI000F76516E|nr:PspA/IM30 family protein [Mesorhizobium sp. M9A.F.Ca.ET.002.03.1.2]AZN96511.1 PspA/IM30 family protein [Mesorhizobium sp. M9A.F.Ca.ET.002.03.1.2]
MKKARYKLILDQAGERDVEATFAAYAAMHDVLDRTGSAHRTNTFELQKLAYEAIRAETGLPARLVTNGIREYASGAWSFDRLPLDDKLMSFKGVDKVSISTVEGRVIAGFLATGYSDSQEKAQLSHLVRESGYYSLTVPLSADMQHREIEAMQTESISGRVSRLAAGLVTTVIDGLEKKAPEAVAEQAIREIDKAADELKSNLAALIAERKRYTLQKGDLTAEREGLDQNIRIALQDGREDLARAGIGRQDDIDAQVTSIDKLIYDVDVRIDEARGALNAASAARRDAEERVKIARRAREAQAPGATAATGRFRKPAPEDRIAAALSSVARLTDLPAGTARDNDLAELEEFGRQRRIDDRLAALRSELKGEK